MQRMTEEDRTKKSTVESYLDRYKPALENYNSLSELPKTEYTTSQMGRSQRIMREVEQAIALLGVHRGKTVIEKRFIGGLAWRRIYKDMDISRDTGYKYYRDAMIELYDLMNEAGIDFGHQTP